MEKTSIRQFHEKLKNKEVSAVEITEQFLRAAQKKEPELNSFITHTPELALQQAAAVDAKIANGESISMLAGIPCGVKDSILLKDIACTAGSKILEHYVAPYDATVVDRLRKHDVVFVGKTNTDEFNMGASTENSAYGVTKNPYDTTRVAGGSSGGSGAAVAADQAHIALGADTGGSIRLPSAFCGVVGVKPTYGAVSRHGLIAMASSLDQVGPMAQIAEDAESVFQAIHGKDEYDATSLEYEYKPLGQFSLAGLKIGIPAEYFGEGLDLAIAEHTKKVIAQLEHAGAHIVEVHMPYTKYGLAAYYIINTSEISANLARYDGIRYGESNQESNDLLSVYMQTRGEYLGAEVKRRIMLGTYALSAGYYEAYYIQAQKIRTLIKTDFEKAFQQVDVLMGPVSPTAPFKIGERTQNPLAMYLGDVYTVPVNLAGLPALSVPIGNVQELPVGLHIIGKPLSEALLFAVAKEVEKLV